MATAVLQKESSLGNRTFLFIVASLFLHAALMMILSRDWNRTALTQSNTSQTSEVDIVPLSQKQIAKIKAQIVETALIENSKEAAKDAFLGAQTQVVRTQTRAKETAAFRDGKTGGAKSQQQERVKAPPATLGLGKLGVPLNLKPMGNLGPGEIASSSDYLKDVKQGSQTMLNTKEFAYFSFYQRVRKQLEQYWEPGLRKRLKSMFDRGRQLANDQEHLTRVMVIMDKQGTITKVLVQSTSGLLDLDQAAVEAFNKAGPFPNPPNGMIESDGTVKVEWEFVLKT